MSGRKTRGRQRIPMRLIENKDDLLVSFSKRRVGVYKKVSELSTLCGVDAGAIIFSPSGIPHSFFTPDLDTVVHGRRNAHATARIRALNESLDEAIHHQEREEKREKQLQASISPCWEAPLHSLDSHQLKDQILCFQALRAQIKTTLQHLNATASFAPPPPPNHNHFDPHHFYPQPGPQGYGGEAGPSRPGPTQTLN